jgi:PEGA domain
MKNLVPLILLFVIIFSLQSCIDKIVVANFDKPQGKIILESVPSGAQIYLLGTKTNKITPDSILELNSGQYEITLKKANYRDTTLEITVVDSLTTSKMVILKSIYETGNIFLESEPVGADIFLDSIKTGSATPDTLKNITIGDHRVTLKKANYRDTTFTLTVETNITASKLVLLKSLVATGNIYIGSSPANAQIFLDSVNTNKVTPDTIKNIVTGLHKITLKKNGYIDTTFQVTVEEKNIVSKTITLNPAVTKGNVYIESNPNGAQIFLDGMNTAKITPDTLKEIATGLHKITLKENNYIDTVINVVIQNNKTISESIKLTPKITTGNIYLSSNPAGAQVFLDSINTGKTTPDTLKNISPGNHKITLKKNNYVDTSVTIAVNVNQTASKTIILTQVIIRGNIFIESVPVGAQIFIDSKNTNKLTPDSLLNYPVGNHSITLKKNDYRDTTFQVNVIGYLTVSKKVTLASINGSIFIGSNPSGAEIYLSDQSTSKTTPDTIKNLAAGTYKITLKYTEYYDTSFYAVVSQNKVTSENITMIKMIQRGDLFIRSNPSGAGIYVDNNNTGKSTPDTIKGLVVGSHDVTLKLNGYFDASLTVNIEKGSVTSENVNLSERVPIQTDTLYYGFILLGQTRFTFSFNQDIILDKVDIVEPGSTDKNSFDFGGEAISQGSTRNIYYPKFLSGEWQLIFYGKKVDTGNSFTLNKTLTIP